jgi:hypothetical protein
LRDIPSFASFVHISYGVILGDEEAREGIALTGGYRAVYSELDGYPCTSALVRYYNFAK